MARPPTRRPRTLLFLIAVLCWQAGGGVEGLVVPARTTTYQFFDAGGLAPVHFVLESLSIAFALAALGYLWRGRAGWAQSAFVALGYFAVQAIGVTIAMLAEPERARAAFVASRSVRGELLDPARVDRLFALGWLEWRLVMSLTLFAIAAFLAWRRRDYVGPDDGGMRLEG